MDTPASLARKRSLSSSRAQRHELLRRAQAAFFQNRFATALRLMDAYVRKWPEDLVAVIKRLNILDFMGTVSARRSEGRRLHRRVESEIRALLESHPRNPSLWIDLGDCLVNLDDFPSAVRCFDRALRILRKGEHFHPAAEELEEARRGRRFAAAQLRSQRKKRTARK